MTDPRQSLLLEIARCPNVTACLTTPNSTHPCSTVVLEQWAPESTVKRRKKSWEEKHQLPEPWVGHLESAPILFISSNPSLWMPKNRYSIDIPPSEPLPRLRDHTREEHPALRHGVGVVTGTWKDEEIADRYSSGFDVFMDETRTRRLKCDGSLDEPVNYWEAVAELASLLQTEGEATHDYAITEVVHCKSKSEAGVLSAVNKCAHLYLRKVLEQSAASLLVVLGKPARVAFRDLFPYKHDVLVLLTPPMEVAKKIRRVVFLGAPTSTTGKYPRKPPDPELQEARAWLSRSRTST